MFHHEHDVPSRFAQVAFGAPSIHPSLVSLKITASLNTQMYVHCVGLFKIVSKIG